MTIRTKLHDLLTEHGLWPEEAEAVLFELENAKSSESMKGHWNDREEDHPPQLVAVLFMSAKRHAVDWIDKNKPRHFARPMLAA